MVRHSRPPGKTAPEPRSRKSGAALPALALGLLVPGLVVAVVAVRSDTTVHEDASGAMAAPIAAQSFPFHATPEDAEPFPVTRPPESYSHPTLQKAYRIARDIPEVLVQLPCLCDCGQSHGHRGLLDCFVDDHAAT